MIKAVLLDLDDTLLGNSDNIFLKAYFDAAENYFASLGIPGMAQAIHGSIGPMYASDAYHMSNVQVAVQSISETLGLPPGQFTKHFDNFYANEFPHLQKLTQRVPQAADVVQEARKRKLAVIIATNPVYPSEAIYQRLQWAGLPNSPDAYDLVTTGENMHFIKPNPAYYAEVLAHIGVEPNETIMVGNSIENDIEPAHQLGIHTFHVTAAAPSQAADATGSLADFLSYMQQGELQTLAPKSLSPAMIPPQLIGNLGALFGLLVQVSPDQWDQHPDPKEWSVRQIVCHLLNREGKVQRARLQKIYSEDNPFLGVPPPDKPLEDVCDENGLDLARDFVAARQETLAFLATLQPEDWSRPARHSTFSNTTLLEMAQFMAQHDRMHITQLCQTLRKCD